MHDNQAIFVLLSPEDTERVFTGGVFGRNPRSDVWWRRSWCLEVPHPKTYAQSSHNAQTHPQINCHTRAYPRLQGAKDSWGWHTGGENRRWKEAAGSHGCITKSLCLPQHTESEAVSLVLLRDVNQNLFFYSDSYFCGLLCSECLSLCCNRKFDQDLDSVSSGLRRLKHLSRAFDDLIGRDDR